MKKIFILFFLCLLIVSVSATTQDFTAPSTNADGALSRSGVDEAWATIIAGAGNTAALSTAQLTTTAVAASATNNQYESVRGYAFSADTSSIPDDATIDSAVFSMYGYATKANSLGAIQTVIIGFTPADPANLVSTDWNTRNKVIKYSANKTYASWDDAGWNNFTITNTSLINKAGYTSLIVDSVYDVYAEQPGWSSTDYSRVRGNDTSAATNDPVLTITWTAASSPTVSAFSCTPLSGASPLSVTCTDASTGSPTNYDWYFGNGTKFNDVDADPTFSLTSGTYDVNLYTNNADGGDWENKSSYISVGGTYTDAVFYDEYDSILEENTNQSFGTLRVDAGDYVYDSNWIASALQSSSVYNTYNYNWHSIVTFNTSLLGSTATVSSATLTAYPAGYQGDLSTPSYCFIDASPANKSAFVAGDYDATTFTKTTDCISGTSFYAGPSPLTFTLTAAGIAAINTTGLTSYMFESDLIINNTEPTWQSEKMQRALLYSYRYSNGTYKPYLTINYSTTEDGPPIAEFTSNVTSCNNPCAVQFTDLSTPAANAWGWSYGLDGVITDAFTDSGSKNPIQTFATSGIYTIFLTATNDAGYDEIYKYDYLTVSDVGTGFTAFESEVTTGKPPLVVQFTDTSTSGPSNWDWYFDNGTKFSDDPDPEVTFGEMGSYDINLYASGGTVNEWSNKSDYIKVGYAPTAHFYMNATV